MMNLVKRLWQEEEGQGMVEYGLIVALISIAALAFFTPIGDGISNAFEKVKDAFDTTT